MSIVDLSTFKDFIGTERAAKDALLQIALDAAEQWVNDYCQRQFAVADTDNPTARTFVPTGCGTLSVGDFVALTSVAIDGDTVDLADIEASGRTVTQSGEQQPYTEIRYTTGGYWWPQWTGPKYSINVVAAWGWTEVPPKVQMATLICAKDIWRNKDVDFGIAGFTEYAGIRARENPQVGALLDPYRRVEAWGIA